MGSHLTSENRRRAEHSGERSQRASKCQGLLLLMGWSAARAVVWRLLEVVPVATSHVVISGLDITRFRSQYSFID